MSIQWQERTWDTRLCLDCGEANARVEIARKAKCTAPAFNKGAYQYVGSIEAVGVLVDEQGNTRKGMTTS